MSRPACGTGISVLTDDGVRAVCAASDLARELVAELRFVRGEGPGLNVQHSGARAAFAFPRRIPYVANRSLRIVARTS